MTTTAPTIDASSAISVAPQRKRLKRVVVAAVVVMLVAELVWAWPTLSATLSRLSTPHLGWLAAAVVAEMASIRAYGRMQRWLLRSAGVKASVLRHVTLAYAAHALSVTLPGGPVFSTRLNYRQMRRFGASPAVTSWAIALSGILSATALAVIAAVTAVLVEGAPKWSSLASLLAAVVILTAGVRWIGRHPERTRETLVGVAHRLRRRLPVQRAGRRAGRAAAQAVQWIIERAAELPAQLRAVRLRPAPAAAAAGYALLNWLLDAAGLWLSMRAVGVGGIDGAGLLLVFCTAMAVGTITVLPGGLGIIDNALIFGLVAGGVEATAAIAAVALYRIVSLGYIVGLGWIGVLFLSLGGKSLGGKSLDRSSAPRPAMGVDRAGAGPVEIVHDPR